MIKAEIIADSVNVYNSKRITTFLLTYPRFIHSEFMTHRVFTRNAASCLSGDTLVNIGHLCVKNIPIKEIVDMWHNGNQNILKAMNLRCVDESTGEFTFTTIENCFYQGIQNVYEIELENSYKLKCTSNHRIYSQNGWIKLSDYNIKHDGKDTTWDSVIPHIAINGVFLNYSKIKTIKYIGKEETYDIEVTGKHKNFIANGIVVHNSRAIPFEKMLQNVLDNPAEPIHWSKNKKGMSAEDELPQSQIELAKNLWKSSMYEAIASAKQLHALGLHKALVNRLLEPYMNITVLCTATEYENFFKLRNHKAAQPEIHELARQMQELYKSNKPVEKYLDFSNYDSITGYHLPFADKLDSKLDLSTKLKVIIARCARLSYLTFDGNIDIEKDIQLYETLKESGHWSPFEHIAILQGESIPYASGNFIGWNQYRKLFKGENGISV